MIIDSQEVAKIGQCLSVVTFYIIIVQYQNQEISIRTMCVSRSVHFTTFVDSCNHHCSQDTEFSITTEMFLVIPLYGNPHPPLFLPPPYLLTTSSLFCL